MSTSTAPTRIRKVHLAAVLLGPGDVVEHFGLLRSQIRLQRFLHLEGDGNAALAHDDFVRFDVVHPEVDELGRFLFDLLQARGERKIEEQKGLTVYGKHFGNYNQDILIWVLYKDLH